MRKQSKTKSELLLELEELKEKFQSLKEAISKDYSEVKRTEEAGVVSESNLQALINNKNESIWSLDTDYNLIVCNDFFRNSYKLAYDVDLKLGVNLVGILSPELKKFWKPKYDKALSGEKQTFEFNEEIQGQQFYFDVFLNPIISEGKITGVSALSIDVTERQRSEQELRESELRFSQLANASFEGIGISDNDVIIDANEQLSKLLGYSHEELIGKKSMDFVAPESRAIVIKNKESESLIPYEHQTIRKDGTVFPVEVQSRTVPFKGRLVRVTAIRDITQRKWAEEALREANQKLKLHFERTPMAVIEWDLDFKVTQWNPSAQVIFGFTRQEALGQHVSFIVPEETRPYVDNVLTEVISNKGGERNTNQNIRKDGRIIHCEWYNTSLIDDRGITTGVASIVHDITARKMAEIALIESEKKFRLFVENAIEGIMAADKDNKITFLNQRMEEMLGYSSEDLIGKPFDFFIFPEELNDFEQKMNSRKQGTGEVFERKYKRKDGSAMWALVSASPILNADGAYSGSLGMLTDITDRKEADEILRESEERFRSVAESANDAIITINNKGMISGWNRGAVRIFGYSIDEITGYDIGLIISQITFENQKLIIKHDFPDIEPDFSGKTIELKGYHKSGREFPLEISMAEWETPTGKFFTGIIRDITDRKKAEEALIKAKEKAEESDRLKISFLGNMSHEVRTPMNGILGFAELLKNPNLTNEEKLEYIEIIENSGQRMMNILNDLIDISKIESGQMEIVNLNCNVNKLANFIFSFFKPDVDKKGLKFSLHIGLPENEANIKTDPDKLIAILTNLVKNAVKFTMQGSIEVGYRKIDKNLEFFVKDTGDGIKEELKEIIFERFRQGSESLSRSYEGAGLGLPISKSYVKMLGGKIWVKNNTDENHNQSNGSVFYFTIPFIQDSGKQMFGHNEISVIEKVISDIKLKVLITEDHEPSEKLLSKIIKDFSEKIIVAKTGIEAVAACRNNQDIDLVFMDIKMPEMDGFEATRQIRLFNKRTVIIAQTAYAQIGDRDKALNAGCNEYISKPLNKDQLLILIEKYFK
jgi:PAS domain S-box-containing protein